MRELPQTLIQVQTLVRALGMEKSMGLTKVHTCTWLPEDRSIHVGHRAAFMPRNSTPPHHEGAGTHRVTSSLTWASHAGN